MGKLLFGNVPDYLYPIQNAGFANPKLKLK